MSVPAGAVLRLLAERSATLAVAESLTGGLLCAELVSVPGASAHLRGGVTAYATDLKASLLGVPLPLLDARGPVDGDVAAAMALGVRTLLGADVGVATTGVAGPDPQDGHPPGTVHVAVDRAGHPPRRRALALTGDREAVRRASVAAALDLLAEALA